MNADKYKSVAIDIKTYRLLEALSKKGFDLEVSLSRACKEAVKNFAQLKKVA